MARQTLLLLTFLACTLHAQAVITTTAAAEVSGCGLDAGMLLPSPDGSLLAAGSFTDEGIWLYTTGSAKITRLTSARGAAWGFAWDAESRKIAVRENTWAADGKSKTSAIAVYGVDGARTVVAEGLPDASLPYFSTDGNTLWYKEEGKEWSASGEWKSDALVLQDGKLLQIREGKISVPAFASPAETSPVLRVTASKDGSRVLTHTAGKGITLTDTRTNITTDFGKGEHPVWITPRLFSFVAVYDDGRKFTGSTIFLGSVSGRIEAVVTVPGHNITLYPVITAGGTLFFSDDNGKLYKASLTLPD